MKEKLISCTLLKLKTSLQKTLLRMKRQATDYKKIFATPVPEKGLVFKTYKDLLKLKNKKN
jgi:hypothetical protein